MKKILYIISFGVFIIVLLGFFALNYLHRAKIVDETRTVYINKTDNGFQLFRNGNPFYIKGAGGTTYLMRIKG